MKTYKDFTKELYSLFVSDTFLSSDNPIRFRKKLLQKSVSDKIKAINNKIKQNKAQRNLDQCTAKISALSSGNIDKYEFLTDKDILPEQYLLRKTAPFKKV